MATEAYRQKRLAFTKAAIEKLTAKKEKAEREIEKAEADIDRYDRLLSWLETMPVEDAPEPEPEATEGEPSA
jgi:hypothetical protein